MKSDEEPEALIVLKYIYTLYKVISIVTLTVKIHFCVMLDWQTYYTFAISNVDGNKVEESNLNRQNYVHSDIGEYKAETLGKRLMDSNSEAKVTLLKYVQYQQRISSSYT